MLKPDDILEWIENCINQCEADGYQQNEGSKDLWYTNPEESPEIKSVNNKEMIVQNGGDLFRVKVTKIRLNNRK